MRKKNRLVAIILASAFIAIDPIKAYATVSQLQNSNHRQTNSFQNQSKKTAICLPIVGCVDTPLPNAVEKPLENSIQKKALRTLFRGIIDNEVPIVVSTDNKYNIVSNLPGGEFNPQLLDLTGSINENAVIEPGDYIIPVKVYCLKQRAKSPNGKRYVLSEYKGKYRDVLKDLNQAASKADVSHEQLQTLSWNIQAGVPYSQMSANSKQVVEQLIPQHKKKLEGSWWDKIEREWRKAAQNYNIPSFESLMSELGDVGKTIDRIKQFREYLIQNGSNYQALSNAFIIDSHSESQDDVLRTPWSQLKNNVYGRFVTLGNYKDTGLLLLRVLPSKEAQPQAANKGIPAVIGGVLLVTDLLDLIALSAAIAEGKQEVQPLAMSYDPTAVMDLIDVLDTVCNRTQPIKRVRTLLCSITKRKKILSKKPGKISNIARKPGNNRKNPDSNSNRPINRHQSRKFTGTYTTKVSFERQARRTGVKKAERVNQELNYQRSPYKPGTNVEEFITKEEMIFVRVHGDNQKGRWIMRKDQIEGLTDKQIRERFSIPQNLDTKISEVRVPANTRIRRGIANPITQFKGKDLNQTQYELLDKLPDDSFARIDWKYPKTPIRR